MKSTDVRTVVRIPLGDIAGDIAHAHGIRLQLSSVKIEGDSLVLEFADAGTSPERPTRLLGASPEESQQPHAESPGAPASKVQHFRTVSPPIHRKRRSARRNRMKTRGWNVVTKTTNSHGQTVTIYEPFVKALDGLTGPRRQKEKIVAEILRANGNRPGPDSIRYYLENTLEYLAQQKPV